MVITDRGLCWEMSVFCVYCSVIMGEEYIRAGSADLRLSFEKATCEMRLSQPGWWRLRGGTATCRSAPPVELWPTPGKRSALSLRSIPKSPAKVWGPFETEQKSICGIISLTTQNNFFNHRGLEIGIGDGSDWFLISYTQEVFQVSVKAGPWQRLPKFSWEKISTVVDGKNSHKFFLSLQEVESVSLLLEVGLAMWHVLTCRILAEWCKKGMLVLRGLLSLCSWGHWDCQHVHKPGMACRR